MARDMRFRGGVALLFAAFFSACYGTPRTTFPDPADGGTGGVAGSAGAGGSVAGAGGGTCNPACDATHACSGGRCLLADAQQCVTPSQCASDACNPFYRDVDGDGYGTGQAVGFCTLTTPPIGYAAVSGDCCDDAANIAVAKLIHPNADFQMTSAGGICGISWDYDCSGAIESSWMKCSSCTPLPDCNCVYSYWPEDACGKTEAQTPCVLQVAGAGMNCFQTAAGPGPVTCR